jgi:hypothetical protein
LASENGVVAKLVDLRQAFLAVVDGARAQFVGTIKSAREEYLGRVAEITLGDPRLSAVEKALGSWNTQPAATAPPEVAAPPAEMVAIGQSRDPMKFPLKENRRPIYGTCPGCNAPIWEPQAKFCSQCAMPLDEV